MMILFMVGVIVPAVQGQQREMEVSEMEKVSECMEKVSMEKVKVTTCPGGHIYVHGYECSLMPRRVNKSCSRYLRVCSDAQADKCGSLSRWQFCTAFQGFRHFRLGLPTQSAKHRGSVAKHRSSGDCEAICACCSIYSSCLEG